MHAEPMRLAIYAASTLSATLDPNTETNLASFSSWQNRKASPIEGTGLRFTV
jgi:hypothetical protein